MNIYIFDCMNLFHNINYQNTIKNINNFFSVKDKVKYLNKNFKFIINEDVGNLENEFYNIYVYQIDYNEIEHLKIEYFDNYMKIGVACIIRDKNNVKDCYQNKETDNKNPNDDYVILQIYNIMIGEFKKSVKIISNDNFNEWKIAPDTNDKINYMKKQDELNKPKLSANEELVVQMTYKDAVIKPEEKKFLNQVFLH